MKIAIKGHKSRGKEVIQILKSLGGKSSFALNGDNCYAYYCIHENLITILSNPTNYKLYTLEEFEKEFPFKIGNKVTIIGLPEFPKIITKMIWDCDEILYSFEGLNNTWFGAKSLKKFEMNKERNVTLTLEKAKEWYKKGGELKEVALQAYSEKELTKVELPKSWKEFCEKYPVKTGESWLSGQDTILTSTFEGLDRKYKNWIPSKKSAEAHLAMIQLEQLRNCWRQSWVQTPANTGYRISKALTGGYTVLSVGTLKHFLSFPTKEMAEEFLGCFRKLIEQAGDLI